MSLADMHERHCALLEPFVVNKEKPVSLLDNAEIKECTGPEPTSIYHPNHPLHHLVLEEYEAMDDPEGYVPLMPWAGYPGPMHELLGQAFIDSAGRRSSYELLANIVTDVAGWGRE